MKRSLILLVLLLTAAAYAADTLHIAAIHKASRDDEKTYHTSFNQNIITGTVGNRRYTLEQLASWGYYHFQVGSDYEIVKANDKTITVKIQDKKGHESKESLNVVTEEEVQ